MICPNCKNEYAEGITVCPVCNVELIDEKEFREREAQTSEWVTVYTTYDNIEAAMLKSNLESAGIETVIIDKKDSSFPVWGDLSVIKLDVRREDAEKARRIIDDIQENDKESE